MLVVSDVHGAFDDLEHVAKRGQTLLVLGDLLNLMDYRTGEGLVADVLGLDFARASAEARGRGDYQRMRELWLQHIGDRGAEVRAEIIEAGRGQYERMAKALEGSGAYVTYGNVDRPDMLAEYLPDGCTFVDAVTLEIEGVRVGFVGGGISTPVGAAGEVTDEEMTEKLASLGAVELLCSHLPPAIESLCTDVITGREERSSLPILNYIEENRPVLHLFGDVHQPKAERWRIGSTLARNVGYFRATRRPVAIDPGGLHSLPR
ncbi:MAG: metallophosphoesterase [Acidimicrobiia bacterium]|nr:metallophosphoesterase [Acidimicrobiia bacterium]